MSRHVVCHDYHDIPSVCVCVYGVCDVLDDNGNVLVDCSVKENCFGTEKGTASS